MARVFGSLASVNSVPTEGTILLRALKLRPGSRFAVTGEPKVTVIRAGEFIIEDVEPGPAQLTIQGNGATHDIRVDVPERDEVDFLDLLEDVYDWEPAQVSAVKLAAREARRAADEAVGIASTFGGVERLEGWATSASLDAEAASRAEAAARGHAEGAEASEKAAAGSAGRAAESERKAGDDAELASLAANIAEGAKAAAEGSASLAGDAAGTAARDAGRAEAAAGAAEVDSRKAGESAASALSDADRARDEADRAKLIAGGDFAPREHKHVMKDVTDLPEVTDIAKPLSVPLRENDTMIRVDGWKTPQFPGHLTHKRYVDEAIASRAPVSHRHKLSDITDMSNVGSAPSPGGLVVRDEYGGVRVSTDDVDRLEPDSAISKMYFDWMIAGRVMGAYEIRTATSAPAEGTAGNIITIVRSQ